MRQYYDSRTAAQASRQAVPPRVRPVPPDGGYEVFTANGLEASTLGVWLQQAGYRIVFASDARVRETVPRERACLGYLFRQEFRNGNKRLAAKLWVRHADADGAKAQRARTAQLA